MKNTKDAQICEMQETMSVLGGKWAIIIIYVLTDGKKRFKEIERLAKGINTRMLVKELKSLEHHQILTRQAFATIPPTVEYTLTEKGMKLEPILRALHHWSIEK